MLDEEYGYYKENKDFLLRKYLNKVVVIVGKEVIAVYPDVESAVTKTAQERPLGTFLVKEIKENDPPIVFRSRVRYAN